MEKNQVSSVKSEVRVCVPVCEPKVSSLKRAIERAAPAGDVIELRLDCLNDLDSAEISELVSFARSLKRPLILTLRAGEQGGQRAIDATTRLDFWRECSSSFTQELFDIELSLLNEGSIEELDWDRVICSHHDFAGIPDNLIQIYEAMCATKACLLKIALAAQDTIDCLPLFHLLKRARGEGREMIPIGMGPAGITTRILGPSRGAYLTYGALDEESSTAPGQISARTLRELYRIDELTQDTEIFGLVGSPVMHSISPNIHNAAFATTGVDGVYIPFEVHDLAGFMSRMAHPRTRELEWSLRGLSVTAPHKSHVMEFLDSIDPAAKEIGAVNTLVIDDEGIRGYNTDAMTLLKPVLEKVGQMRDARCALIGAGGAAKAALWSLRNEGAITTLFARDEEKGSTLAQTFGTKFEKLAGGNFSDFDLVINATPLGTKGALANESVASATQLRGAHLVYDLVYNPSETLFMKQARDAGCEAIGGISMLVLQGVEQFKLWTGREAPLTAMTQAAEKAL
jgi:3-dehydroquinate dehydratase/shikimate dehydrogenase